MILKVKVILWYKLLLSASVCPVLMIGLRNFDVFGTGNIKLSFVEKIRGR